MYIIYSIYVLCLKFKAYLTNEQARENATAYDLYSSVIWIDARI